MNNPDVVRAWKDEEYRLSLSDAERAQLPAHPAGLIELKDTELDQAAGGTVWVACTVSVIICGSHFNRFSCRSNFPVRISFNIL